jgi:hypothetical protein
LTNIRLCYIEAFAFPSRAGATADGLDHAFGCLLPLRAGLVEELLTTQGSPRRLSFSLSDGLCFRFQMRKRSVFSLPFGNDWRTKELSEAHGVPIFDTQIVDREAFRAMFSFGGSLAGLAGKGVSGLPAALANARAFTQELVDTLRNGVKSVSEAA